MALKLQVPWRDEHEPLQVNDTGLDGVIRKIRASDSPNVDPCGNDDVLVKDFFGECNRVPDVSRYRIGGEGCGAHHDDKYRIWHDRYLIPHGNITGQDVSAFDIPEPCLQARLKELRERREIGNIVLLLESPHKDEYNANPKRPACGTTGRSIDKLLWIVLRYIQIETGLIEPGCRLVISNPIQFQTSLHAIHNKSIQNVVCKEDGEQYNWVTLRDNVWRTLWNEQHIQDCFRARLGCYYPKVIINACTGTLEESDSPKSLVNRFFQEEGQEQEELQNVPLYAVSHPSHWARVFSLRPKRIIPQAEQ